MKTISKLILGVCASFLLFTSPTFSQESNSPVSISGGLDLVSDYRLRGVSVTGKDPAVQGTLTAEFNNGFYLSAWGTNIDDINGAKTEVDWIGGYAGSAEGISYDAGVIYYSYINGTDTNYWEVFGSLGVEAGDIGLTGGIAYAPKQDNLGDDSNLYVYGDASYSIPDTPISLNFHLGLEDGAFGDNKLDWYAGASYEYKAFTLSVGYVDTNETGSIYKGALLASIGVAF